MAGKDGARRGTSGNGRSPGRHRNPGKHTGEATRRRTSRRAWDGAHAAGSNEKLNPTDPTADTGAATDESASANTNQIIGELTNPGVLRALLRKHGVLKTNKSLGQHLLISRAALMDVVDAAQLTPQDAVL